MKIAVCISLLLISKISFSQEKAQSSFTVKEYRASVGNFKDSISKGAFSIQMGVGAEYRITRDHWEGMPVQRFKVCIYRDSTFIFHCQNQGNMFNSEIKKAFIKLKPEDKVLIFDIYALGPDSKERLLNPLQYIIK